MALGDFFRINMPYGMKRNDKNEWFVFNREYKPLGWNTLQHINEEEYPVFTKYSGITETKLLKLASSKEDSVERDEKGKIHTVWFYSDGTNPKDNSRYWNDYVEKIKILSKLKSEEQGYSN